MNKKQIYEIMLDCASNAAARTDVGATTEKILEVVAEFHPEVPLDEKIAERAANAYNNAMARVTRQYAN